MAWQLIYTSAPELLQAGRSGFGTVAKHEAIRPSLQTELERISQFSREDGLKKDRVIFSHRVLDLRGERFHVLSRISDAGYDYTGRTKHIAHHIVLTADEVTQAGARSCTPADMILWLTAKDRWINRWNEPARLLTPSEEIATGTVSRVLSLRSEQGEQGAVTWREVAGPAANAAILAPGGSATEACWPIFQDHWDEEKRLRLIGESLCLHIDPWTISFSTDTQPTDRIEELRWRGVSAGSPVKHTARQSVRPTLDLADPTSLQKYIGEDFRNQAETGLKKSPAAEISLQSPSPTGSNISQGSATTANPFAPKGGGEIFRKAEVKLSDRMSKGGGDTPSHSSGSWLLLAAIISAFIAIAVLIWNACIFNRQDIKNLSEPTLIIIDKLTDKKGGYPDDDWWDNKAESKGFPIVGGYAIGAFGFKEELRAARDKLSELQKSESELPSKFNQAVNNLKDKRSILGIIIAEIEKYRAQAKDEADRQKEKNNLLAEKPKAPEMDEAEALSSDQEKEKNKPEELPVKAEQEKKSRKQEFSSIRLFSYADHDYAKLFPNNKLPADTIAWDAKFHKASILGATNIIGEISWKTNPPSNIPTTSLTSDFQQFKIDLENSDFTFFIRKDNSQILHLLIVFNGDNNGANGKKIILKKVLLFKNDELINILSSPEVDDLIKLLPLGEYNLKYDVITEDGKAVKLKNGIQTVFSANSIAELADLFNNTKLELMKKSTAPVMHAAESAQKDTEDFKKLKSFYNDAGYSIYGTNIIIGVPPPSYEDWISRSKLDNTDENYIKYISSILSNNQNYFNSRNSGQYQQGPNQFGSLSVNVAKKTSISELFTYMNNQKIPDFEKNLDAASSYPKGSDEKKARDTIFINNLKGFFNPSNISTAVRLFPKVQPDLQKPFKDGLNELNDITSDLSSDKPANYRAIIRVSSGTNPLLYITP